MSTRVIVAPATEPVDVAYVKAQAHQINWSEDDTYIEGLIPGARAEVEHDAALPVGAAARCVGHEARAAVEPHPVAVVGHPDRGREQAERERHDRRREHGGDGRDRAPGHSP